MRGFGAEAEEGEEGESGEIFLLLDGDCCWSVLGFGVGEKPQHPRWIVRRKKRERKPLKNDRTVAIRSWDQHEEELEDVKRQSNEEEEEG